MEIKTEMFIVNMHGVVRDFQFFESQVQNTDIFDYQLWILDILLLFLFICRIAFQFSRKHTQHTTHNKCSKQHVKRNIVQFLAFS